MPTKKDRERRGAGHDAKKRAEEPEARERGAACPATAGDSGNRTGSVEHPTYEEWEATFEAVMVEHEELFRRLANRD